MAGTDTRWSASPILTLLLLGLVGAGPVAAGGAIPTSCNDLCAPSANPCVVSSTINVAAGSVIDCGTRAVHVTGGALLAHDALFALKAGSLLVNGNGRIASDCPSGSTYHGFNVVVTGTISVPDGGQGKLAARCAVAGGIIRLTAGGAVTIGAYGIDASSTAADGPGGTIAIAAGGAFTNTAELVANAFGGNADGGSIDIEGASVSLQQTLQARGSGEGSGSEPGGSINVESLGTLTVLGSGHVLDAGTAQGDGGEVVLRAAGDFQCNRLLKARGTGSQAEGGTVDVEAESITLDNAAEVYGGERGGELRLVARRGAVKIGTQASSGFILDAGGGQAVGGGGSIRVESHGNDVVVGAQAKLHAKGGGGEGGDIVLVGASVTTAGGSELDAHGAAGAGGQVSVQARDALSLVGTVQATNGKKHFVYRAGTPVLSGVVGAYTLRQDASLPAPCGDGIQRLGVEACDAPDYGTATCPQGGALGCLGNCTALDYAGCN